MKKCQSQMKVGKVPKIQFFWALSLVKLRLSKLFWGDDNVTVFYKMGLVRKYFAKII